MNSKYVSNIYVGEDGKLHKVIGGADTVLPFNKGIEIKTGSYSASPNASSGENSATVSFGYTFSKTPNVYIIPYVSQSNVIGVRRISSITTTGFTFRWYSSNAGYTRVNLNWLAYES